MKRKYLIVIPMLLVGIIGFTAVRQADPGPIVATIILGSWFPTASVVVDTRTRHAFVGTASGIAMVDVKRGALLRTISMSVSGVPVVDPLLHRMYVPMSGGVAALDAATGRQLWIAPVTPNPAALAIDVQRDRLYVGWAGGVPCENNVCTSQDGTLYAVDARVGRIRDTVVLSGQGELQLAMDARARRLVVLGGNPYGGRARVTIFNTLNGHRLQRFALAGPCSGFEQAPLVADGQERVLAPCVTYPAVSAAGGPPPKTPYGLVMLDSRTGARTFATALSSTPDGVAIDARRAYFFVTVPGVARLLTVTRHGQVALQAWEPTGLGHVQMRDLHTGTLRWTATVGINPTSVLVDPQRQEVYVTSIGTRDPRSGSLVGPGWLTVLDEQNGRVRRTVTLGTNPQAMALDASANRLIVVNAGDFFTLVQPSDPWSWMPRWLRALIPFLPQHAPEPVQSRASMTILDTARL